MAMVKRAPIGSLQPTSKDVVVIAIVIGKSDSRSVIMRKDGTEKYVTTFTLRDSIADMINFTIWSSRDEAEDYQTQFGIGSVVEIISPRVSLRELNSPSENYSPSVSSPLKLTFQEGKTVIGNYMGNLHPYLPLLNIPSKDSAGYFRIKDVLAGERLVGKYVDICAGVRGVGSVRTFPGKNGVEKQLREVKLFDITSHCLVLKIWDAELIRLSESWIPRKTVLFLADICVSYDSWRNSNNVTCTGKTIITENPNIEEAIALAEHSEVANFSSFSRLDTIANSIDIETVTLVDTVSSLQELSSSAVPESESLRVTLLYGYVTRLDVDEGDDPTITRCISCQVIIPFSENDGESVSCDNIDCAEYRLARAGRVMTQFNVRVDVSDETGTIVGCRIRPEFLESYFKVKASEFVTYTQETKTEYKLKMFLKPLKICLGVLLPTVDRKSVSFTIISAQDTSLEEIAAKMPSPFI